MDDISPSEAHEELLRQLAEMPEETREKIANVLELLQTELMYSAQKETKELLFCGADAGRVVKCLHFPAEVLDYPDGPVLLPSSNPKVILGAVTDELIHRKISEYASRYDDLEEREARWEIYLNSVAIQIAELHDAEGGWDFNDLLA